ncbi:G protein-coupled glucose receptor regulating Gpa2-domain-containing protein [Pyronema domesticum]|uniref:G protein-coupled receptor GPR1/2/3 C-terminal domain-containing protein n=1 Tax=Pyronema omphalodes (strain CBS 100304) TaxID=1076935 RepID=U4LHC5_PYROM|nr:G protein-coupled glucose receptor regulating Gpa2-domain-containing protein [Pyronema domesticum]CCX11462.1 Similar to hypothetical protein SNOG_00993 [Phaeosphaeria nodorum SN15]; acc. no. XP_001791654 [Pyronema omphalodes CBS 100304]
MAEEYYPYPKSLDPIPSHLRAGLAVIATFGILSLITSGGAITFIVYRLTNKKKYQAIPLRYNQPLILILNLLIADFQQALSFIISIVWLKKNAILAPTDACAAQGWLVQVGDVSSGLFSLGIACQTFYVLVLRRSVPYKMFVSSTIALWVFCLSLSLISPILHHRDELFVSAGAWCWISDKYKDERLLVHYIWIFICEFGTLALYAVIFMVLTRNGVLNNAAGVQARTIQRIARLMLVYPLAYTCLTLPLAAFRMATQSGKQPNDKFLLLAGACMASCGWVDVLLYLVTRRTIVYQHSIQTTSQAITGGVGGIQMNPALPYGNNTVIGGGGGMTMHSGNHDSPSVSSSQENFVKLEQVVQVTVERATPGEQAAVEAAQKQLRGNPTYW